MLFLRSAAPPSLLLALPVFLLAGWSIAGWGLAAVLWVAVHAIDLVLRRTRARRPVISPPPACRPSDSSSSRSDCSSS